MNKRYAWTDSGPLEIIGGKNHTTQKCKTMLAKDYGIVVTAWARNWADFLGFAGVLTVRMD